MTRTPQDSAPSAHWIASRGWTITLGLLALAVLWDLSGWDLQVMRWFGTDHGFALRGNWWLSTVMHTRAQQLTELAYVFLLAMVFWPLGPFKVASRRQRVATLLAITASLVVVTLLKRFSLTSCPWDLSLFGGTANYVPHWRLGASDGGGGHCFPSGHASSALAFLAVSFPALFSPDPARHRHGQHLLLLVLLLGLAFGLTQTVRGAHHPSHTLWTAWVCWTTGWLSYRWAARQSAPEL